MRKDQCLFCRSRKCSYRVVRLEDPKYDEVACFKHLNDLHSHVDNTLGKGNGVGRHYISSTGYLRRGDNV